AYLKGDVSKEINRLETVEGEAGSEKGKLIAKRDELLSELKTTREKYSKFKGHEDVDVAELLSFKEQHSGDENEVEKRYQSAYAKDKKAFENRLAAIEKEREDEKKQAQEESRQRAAANLKADALGELSKGQYKIISSNQFWMLFGEGKVQRDEETGDLFAEVGYKKMSLPDYVAHLGEDVDNQHHFHASGRSGSGGATGGAGGAKGKKWSEMNLTEKTLMLKTEPDKAKSLAAESGSVLNL
ncbi:MAG: hypothetical protein ACR2FS_04635, partial [Phormidesmis sp.]